MIILKDFIHLTQEEIKLVLKWRNDESIAKFMKTQNISLEEHLNFLSSLKTNATKKYFLVYDDENIIGVIDFINITKLSCEFGLYGIKKGVGELLMQEVKNYAFNVLKVQTLNACVFKENTKALNLYLKHGFKIVNTKKELFYLDNDIKTKKHFFIIGGGSLQADFLYEVKKYFITHVFDYDNKCFLKKEADIFHLISIHEKEKILQLAKQYNIVGIGTTATELGNITSCYVGEHLNLGLNSYEVALNTTDKSRMKDIFKKYHIPTARYEKIYNINELKNIKMNFPLVVKPSDRSAGRGVVKVYDIQQLTKAYLNAKEISYNKIVLVEEVIEGLQYSVETITSNGKHQILAITEEYLRDDENKDDFLETQQLIPARISKENEKIIKKIILKTLKAFGIKYGACHIELKINNNNVKIIEIASRAGGWRNVLIEHSIGLNYNTLILQSILKKKLQNYKINEQHYCLVKMIFTKQDFEFYQFLKKNKPNMIVKDHVLINKSTEFNYSSSLLDSKGYYYIKIPKNENPDKYINAIF
ncbi:UDP-4-amino-4,6-dideoxy-N-acetyl-beta-L-altrosamine N-acetyltransferase [Campylobacter lari]|nr:UDP-4-amino-4,6-dideoxy-N-acetyl-beta-L-altrosamine N-acetyltransferase [Campylobacter lari]